MLLALLEERDAAIEARLASGGTPTAEVIADVRKAVGTGEDRLWDGILITPRVARVIELAGAAVPAALPLEPVHLFTAIETHGGLFAELLLRYVPSARALVGCATRSSRVGGERTIRPSRIDASRASSSVGQSPTDS